MGVRVVVKDRFGLRLNCNGQLAKDEKGNSYLKTQTVILGQSNVMIREPNGCEHAVSVLFIRWDRSEIEYQCVHEITSANPPLHF